MFFKEFLSRGLGMTPGKIDPWKDKAVMAFKIKM